MTGGITIHGGVKLLGNEEIDNLELEELPVDPDSPNVGRVWMNSEAMRVKYVEGSPTGPSGTVRQIANTDDVAALASTTASAAPTVVTNNETQNITLGQPVCGAVDLSVILADAGVAGKQNVIGLISTISIDGSGGTGNMLSTGLITGTTVQWDAVTGQIGGLTPFATYFLDVGGGRITATPPFDTGLYICAIGQAISSTVLSIQIARPITL